MIPNAAVAAVNKDTQQLWTARFVLSEEPGQVSILRELQNFLNSVLFGNPAYGCSCPDLNPYDDPPVKLPNGSWSGFGTIPPYQFNFPRIIKIALKLYF